MAVGNVNLEAVCHQEPSDETLIASDILTAAQSLIVVGAESGTSDNLATVNLSTDFAAACVGYQPLLYLTATIGDTITIKNGTGNIVCNTGADISLTENKVVMLVRFVSTTTAKVNNKWKAIG